MKQYGISIEELTDTSYGAEVFLAVNDTFVGYVLISDTVKADAASAIGRLKKMGLRTVMLTGDSEDSAKSVASETGIDEVYAKLLPQDKLEILSSIRSKYGSVLFVGDGINDAPVLAGADVGAAMGSGADAAIEAADAVFMNSSVESIPQSISIARNTSSIATQNVTSVCSTPSALSTPNKAKRTSISSPPIAWGMRDRTAPCDELEEDTFFFAFDYGHFSE